MVHLDIPRCAERADPRNPVCEPINRRVSSVLRAYVGELEYKIFLFCPGF